MPYMYTFCTWFSVRTGSVIISTLSLIQALAALICTIISWRHNDVLSSWMEQISGENDLMVFKPYYLLVQKNIQLVLSVVTIFLVLYIIACLLLFHGSFYLKEWEIVPYIMLEFIRLIFIQLLIIVVIILVKKNILDFNILLLGMSFCGFFFITLCYFWLCPLSLLQCMLIVRKKEVQAPEDPFINKFNFNNHDILHLYSYLRDFHAQQLTFNRTFYRNRRVQVTPIYF